MGWRLCSWDWMSTVVTVTAGWPLAVVTPATACTGRGCCGSWMVVGASGVAEAEGPGGGPVWIWTICCFCIAPPPLVRVAVPPRGLPAPESPPSCCGATGVRLMKTSGGGRSSPAAFEVRVTVWVFAPDTTWRNKKTTMTF